MKIYPRTSFAPGRVQTAIACGFLAALLAAHHPVVDAQQADATNSPPLIVFAQSKASADQVPLSAQASATLETIQSDPAASDIRIGHSNPDPVLAARALSLALPSAPDACTDSGQGAIDFTDVDVVYNEENLVSVYARDDATDSEVSLVIQGPDVLGSVRCGDEIYKIHPLGDGMTAVYEFDTSRLSPHPPGWGEFIQESWTEIMHEGEWGEDGQAPDTTPRDSPGTPGAAADVGDEIDILVAYTRAAKVGAGNIDAFIQTTINSANRIYANTDINMRLRVVDKYEVSYSQDADMKVDLERLAFRRNTEFSDTGRRPDPQGYMDEIHERRDRSRRGLGRPLRRADSPTYTFADIAYIPNFWKTIPLSIGPVRGFSVTAHSCEALSSYTFTHEIGHNQSADHNPPHAALDDRRPIATATASATPPETGVPSCPTATTETTTETCRAERVPRTSPARSTCAKGHQPAMRPRTTTAACSVRHRSG